MGPRFRVKPLSLQAQAIGLKRIFPLSEVKINRRSLEWQAELLPSPMSDTYTVEVFYQLDDSPKVNVLKPELAVPEGLPLPHTYPEERLCLYYPKAGEWRKDMSLSSTIIPWISEWLLHYEIWLQTGKWCGGGIHPPKRKDNNSLLKF